MIKKVAKAILNAPRRASKAMLKKFYIEKAMRNGGFDVPIYIISYNRLSYVKQMVQWLKEKGYSKITIIDNASTEEGLLSYYESTDCNVVRMKKNHGHLVFLKHPRFLFNRNAGVFVLTDPDLDISDDCPDDFICMFLRVMNEYRKVSKVGFSLEIGDLPDTFYAKEEVVKWESQFWRDEIQLLSGGGCKAYLAPIDTTFALYEPRWLSDIFDYSSAIRVGYPYSVRHLPWYVGQSDSETKKYLETIRGDITTWNGNRTKAELREMMGLSRNEKRAEE